MKNLSKKFFRLNNNTEIVYCVDDNNQGTDITVIDICDPVLKTKSIPRSRIKEYFSFDEDFPKRSQLLYRRDFYKTKNSKTRKNLGMLRAAIDF